MLIFLVWIIGQHPCLSYNWVMWLLIVTNLEYSQNCWKHEDQNEIKQQEYPEIIKYLFHHGYNIWQLAENSQKEECLNEHNKCNNYQNDVTCILNCIDKILVVIVVVVNLKYDVKKPKPNVHLINVVPFITEVFSKALFGQLGHVVDQRIDQAHEHC